MKNGYPSHHLAPRTVRSALIGSSMLALALLAPASLAQTPPEEDAPEEEAPFTEPADPEDAAAEAPEPEEAPFTEDVEPPADVPAEQPPAQQPPAAPPRGATPATRPPPALDRGSVAAHEAPSDTSPQNAALELRFGPYLPRVDEGTTRPVFEEFFGDDNRFLLGFELDWQIWRAPYVGTLGLGVGLGYTFMTAPNVLPGGEEPSDGQSVTQDSTLNIVPMYAVGVLRVDVLAREVGIPLVPYGKLGVGYALWWVDDGVETARNDEGVVARDASTGTQMALGAMLLLDIFEPVAARTLDGELGINNSYIFFEWSSSNFDGAQMNVGANTWATGLAIEM